MVNNDNDILFKTNQIRSCAFGKIGKNVFVMYWAKLSEHC